MSQLLLLHLSDLHFGLNRFPDTDLADIAKILGERITLKSQELKVPLSLVCVTGDISNTADPTEYELALRFMKTLKSSLNIDPWQFVFVPGNHDVSYPTCEMVHLQVKLAKLAKEQLPEEIEKTKFDVYQEHFLSPFQPNAHVDRKETTLLNHGKIIRFPDLKLSIAALNSCENITHEQSKGLLSDDQMQALMDQSDIPHTFSVFAIK